MAGNGVERDRDCARVDGGGMDRSSEEEDLLHRSTKKVKGSDGDFSGECTGVKDYSDLELLEEVESPRSKSYREALAGVDDLQEMDGTEFEDDDEDSNDEADRDLDDDDEMESEKPAEEYVIIEHPKGKHSVPEFIFSKKVEERICVPFKMVIVVKLLGRMIGIKALESRLKAMWERKGEIYVTDVPNDYFFVLFDKKEDYEYALEGGPWMI